MASIISAGNATNGLAVSSDNTGILQLKTGPGAGTTAISIDASQNATFAGTVTQPTGTLYPIVSGTVNAGGTAPFPATGGPTSVDFTGIPAWAKRLTVLFNGVSTSGTAGILIQLGTASGGVENTGYTGISGTTGANYTSSTAGFVITPTAATNVFYGALTLTLFQGASNTWVGFGLLNNSVNSAGWIVSGAKSTSAVVDRVRITTATGTPTFTAGSINILWE